MRKADPRVIKIVHLKCKRNPRTGVVGIDVQMYIKVIIHLIVKHTILWCYKGSRVITRVHKNDLLDKW